MIVDLLRVTDDPLPFELELRADQIDLETEGISIAGVVKAVGEVTTNSAKTTVTGSIKAPVEVGCTRCLTDVKQDLDIVFQVDFVGKELFPESKEVHLESSELDTDLIEGNELDLTQVVREQILLNLPDTVLCRDECKGICPTCGKDLNEGECQCGGEDIDPRWAALKDLKG